MGQVAITLEGLAALTTKQRGGLITRAHNSEKVTVALYQAAGVAALQHAEQHGDRTLLERLVNGMGGKGYRAAMVAWVGAFSPIRFNGDGKSGVQKKDPTPWDIPGAFATLFTTYEPDPEKKPLSLEALLRIINGMEKRVEKAEATEEPPAVLLAFAAHMAEAAKAFKAPDVANDEPINGEFRVVDEPRLEPARLIAAA